MTDRSTEQRTTRPVPARGPEDTVTRPALADRVKERLTRAGFSTGGVDGRIGPNTLAAVRAFQSSVGLLPDGYANPALLQRLR